MRDRLFSKSRIADLPERDRTSERRSISDQDEDLESGCDRERLLRRLPPRMGRSRPRMRRSPPSVGPPPPRAGPSRPGVGPSRRGPGLSAPSYPSGAT